MKIKPILLKNKKSILNLGEFSTPPRLSPPPANYVLGIFSDPPSIPTSLLLGTKEYCMFSYTFLAFFCLSL